MKKVSTKRKSHSNIDSESIKCLYDWERRWHWLRVVNIKGSAASVNLIVGGRDTFKEMYDKGFLTGQAKEDARRMFG